MTGLPSSKSIACANTVLINWIRSPLFVYIMRRSLYYPRHRIVIFFLILRSDLYRSVKIDSRLQATKAFAHFELYVLDSVSKFPGLLRPDG